MADNLQQVKDALTRAEAHEEAMRLSLLLARSQVECLKKELDRLEKGS